MSETTGQKGTPDVVQVTIGGRRYRLRGSDPEQLQRLAATVDRTLEEIAGPGSSTDDFKVAVRGVGLKTITFGSIPIAKSTEGHV